MIEKISLRNYINKLLTLELISLLISLTCGVLQSIAVGTNEWFVLNVNEFIPTSKGGLWFYCYISNTGFLGQFSCFRYEDLPNFAIFINRRLYDARIILICSCGFCLILNLAEVFGIICLFNAEKFDLIASLASKKTGRLSPSDSVNNNSNNQKPNGYFAYLSIGIIGILATSMDFVLKVTGFILFDSYISHLLSFNTVFLAYKSYSYWLMLATIFLLVFYCLFKAVTIFHVVKITKKLTWTQIKSSAEIINFQKNWINKEEVNVNKENMKSENVPAVKPVFVFESNNEEDSFSIASSTNNHMHKTNNFLHNNLDSVSSSIRF